MGAFSYTSGPCDVCGKRLTAAGFARIAHEDMHIRNGDLLCVHVWTWKGAKLRSKVIKPKDREFWEVQGYFETFERCKEVYSRPQPLAPRGSRV